MGGLERVYELVRQFRNEGMDATHSPELTSMGDHEAVDWAPSIMSPQTFMTCSPCPEVRR